MLKLFLVDVLIMPKLQERADWSKMLQGLYKHLSDQSDYTEMQKTA